MKLNARHLLVQKAEKQTDPLVDEVLNDPEGSSAILYKRALGISKSETRKSYVEACLLAEPNLAAISEVLEMPEELIAAYRDFFYDIAEVDKLGKIELIDQDPSTSSLKMWALSQGLNFIAWRLGKSVQISPVDGLQEMFSNCMYKAKEALFAGNASPTSKESVKWVKLSLDIARLLKVWVMDSAAARKDLELAIQEVVPDFKTIDDLDGFDVEKFVLEQQATMATLELANKTSESAGD